MAEKGDIPTPESLAEAGFFYEGTYITKFFGITVFPI